MHFYLQWFVIYHDLSILDFLCSFYVAFMKANGFFYLYGHRHLKPAKNIPIGIQIYLT
jgi:hypothetical protein